MIIKKNTDTTERNLERLRLGLWIIGRVKVVNGSAHDPNFIFKCIIKLQKILLRDKNSLYTGRPKIKKIYNSEEEKMV